MKNNEIYKVVWIGRFNQNCTGYLFKVNNTIYGDYKGGGFGYIDTLPEEKEVIDYIIEMHNKRTMPQSHISRSNIVKVEYLGE